MNTPGDGLGVQLVCKSGEAFDSIAARVNEIDKQAAGIAELSQTQACNLQHVNGAVREMGEMTQNNAAMVEESNAASRSLASEAEQLTTLVSRFRLSTRRDEAAAPRAEAARKPKPRAATAKGNVQLIVRGSNAAVNEDWSEF